MNKKIILLSTFALLGGLIGCAPSEIENSSSSMSETLDVFSFEKKEITLQEDTLLEISYEASGKARFESSDPDIALMNGHKLLAKKVGVTTIKGSVGKAFDTLTVKVLSSSDENGTINLNKKNEIFSLEAPSNFQIEANLEGSGEKNIAFQYVSKNEEVASVSKEGLVTPLKEGTAEIEVSFGAMKEVFTADIYTKQIKNTEDWLGILKNLGAFEDRYYLANDIDFSGVSYEGYKLASDWNTNLAFSSEVNGFGHSLKNITMGKTIDGHQSLFGWLNAAKIRNIGFENVTFTSTEDHARFAGLATYAMHNDDKRRANTIENVSLDLHFPDTGAERTGFFGNGYDYQISNSFVSMKTLSGKPFKKGRDALVNAYNYFWSGKGLVSNTLFLSENELPTRSLEGAGESSGEVELSASYLATEEMDAIYGSYNVLDQNYWDLSEESLPTLKTLL